MLIVGPPLATVPEQQPLWLAPLFRWASMGVFEREGDQDHPLIVEMLAAVGLGGQHDETPWCSAAMNAAMAEVGLRGTGSARARSWEAWGERLQRPRFGCLAVLQRGAMSSGLGHVACWLGDFNGSMALLGGNQINRVCLAPYPEYRLLSFRWPDEGCLLA